MQEGMKNKGDHTILLGLIGLLLMVWGATAYGFVICPFRLAFGFSCPGCGLTRATIAMIEGDWQRMWNLHPLAPLIVSVMLAAGTNITLNALGVTNVDYFNAVPRPIGYLFLSLLFGVWVVRLTGLFGEVPEPFPPTDGWFHHLFLSH